MCTPGHGSVTPQQPLARCCANVELLWVKGFGFGRISQNEGMLWVGWDTPASHQPWVGLGSRQRCSAVLQEVSLELQGK